MSVFVECVSYKLHSNFIVLIICVDILIYSDQIASHLCIENLGKMHKMQINATNGRFSILKCCQIYIDSVVAIRVFIDHHLLTIYDENCHQMLPHADVTRESMAMQTQDKFHTVIKL